MRIALLIQYVGSAYHGWQVQQDPQTIQGLLEHALAQIYQRRISLTGSGRTDSGVHALGQVAHFDVAESSIPIDNLAPVLNRILPEEIGVVASRLVSPEFHSRFAAIRRDYCYTISTQPNVLQRNHQWYVRFPLVIDKLACLAALIQGSHDFSSFCYAGTETQNMQCHILDAHWDTESEGVLSFHVAGDRFLHHMVRMLVGSMVEVARGKWSTARFEQLLNSPDRQAHVVTAPARGLVLRQVNYPAALQPDWGGMTSHAPGLPLP